MYFKYLHYAQHGHEALAVPPVYLSQIRHKSNHMKMGNTFDGNQTLHITHNHYFKSFVSHRSFCEANLMCALHNLMSSSFLCKFSFATRKENLHPPLVNSKDMDSYSLLSRFSFHSSERLSAVSQQHEQGLLLDLIQPLTICVCIY